MKITNVIRKHERHRKSDTIIVSNLTENILTIPAYFTSKIRTKQTEHEIFMSISPKPLVFPDDDHGFIRLTKFD